MSRVLAVLLLLGSLLPWAAWLDAGVSDPDAVARAEDWALGTALCVVAGLLGWFITRQRTARHGVSPASEQAAAPIDVPAPVPVDGPAERRWMWLLSLGAAILYAAIAQWMYSGLPLHIDELVQAIQAQDLAAGRLTHVFPGPPEFFTIVNEVTLGDRAFGHFPVGGPAMLVPGVLLGLPWLMGPLFGAGSVWMFGALLRQLEPDATAVWRLWTVAAFALAPFAAFMFGSQMNHGPTLFWLLVATVALLRAVADEGSPRWAGVAGVALGIAAAIRPLDGFAFAVPAAAWLLWRLRTGPSVRQSVAVLVAAGVGVALPIGALLWSNAVTTGAPLTFAYEILWGPLFGPGFHPAPWGPEHTPSRGLALLTVYLARLNTYLLELPVPALVLVSLGLWLRPRLTDGDRYLLGAAAAIALGYWAYWHDGFFAGPRFLFAVVPVAVLWAARGYRALDARCDTRATRRGLRTATAVAIALASVSVFAVRVPTYRNAQTSVRIAPDAAARAGVTGALVFVQESWGAQIVVRLWARGISHPDTELLYRSVDSCALDERLRALEAAGVQGADARAALWPLLRDSARVVASDLSPDGSERRLPGFRYTQACVDRINEDRGGYLHFAPWRVRQDGNVYARWLPGREMELAASFPRQPVYRVRRAGPAPDAPLVWERLDVGAGDAIK